jgi:hypothetical protein
MNACEYCGSDNGVKRAGPEDGLQSNVYVCNSCWSLLKDPTTALSLIRGHLIITQRGKVSDSQLKKRLNEFMEIISKWKPKN